MTASALVAEARARGVLLRADGALLRIRWPGPQPIPELRHALMAHKPAILRLLSPAGSSGEATVPADPCSECRQQAWMALVGDDGTRTCADCATGRTALRRAGVTI